MAPATHDADKVAAFIAEVERWVNSGSAVAGKAQLCVRVLEPTQEHSAGSAKREDGWRIELLARDLDEPSLVVPLEVLWAGPSPFAPGAIEELLGALGRLVRMAPELAPVLDGAVSTGIELDDHMVLEFVRDRTADLEDAGIAVLLPSWWTRRRRLGLRATTSSRGDGGAVAEAGFSLEQMVTFTWQAALGDRRLTKADLRKLEAAASTKRALVRVRGEWVQVAPGDIEAILRHIDTAGEATGTVRWTDRA